jgi:hypothetical protein
MKAQWAAAAVVPLLLVGCGTGAPPPVAQTVTTTTDSAGRGGPTTNWAVAIQQWKGRSEPAVSGLQDAMRDLGIAMKSQDYASMRMSCHDVGHAVSALGAALPSPDASLTVALQSAVDSFETATQTCDMLTPGAGADVVNDFVTRMHDAISHMDTAMTMMGGAPPI